VSVVVGADVDVGASAVVEPDDDVRVPVVVEANVDVGASVVVGIDDDVDVFGRRSRC